VFTNKFHRIVRDAIHVYNYFETHRSVLFVMLYMFIIIPNTHISEKHVLTCNMSTF